MAENFILTFTNGVAPAEDIKYGSYTLSVGTVNGYADATIDPSTLTVDDSTPTSLPITLTATGSATVTITDSDGNPVTSGVTFERYVSLSDPTGYTPVAGVIDDSQAASGIYTINYLPYVETTGIDVYFKVSAPDSKTTDFTINMDEQNVTGLTLVLENEVSIEATLEDAKFSGFPLDGTITGTAL